MVGGATHHVKNAFSGWSKSDLAKPTVKNTSTSFTGLEDLDALGKETDGDLPYQ